MRTKPTLITGLVLILCTLAYADPPPDNLPSSFTLHVKAGSISQDVHFTWDGYYSYEGRSEGREQTLDGSCRPFLIPDPYGWQDYWAFHCWFYVDGGNLCTADGYFDPDTGRIIIEWISNGGEVWVVD